MPDEPRERRTFLGVFDPRTQSPEEIARALTEAVDAARRAAGEDVEDETEERQGE